MVGWNRTFLKVLIFRNLVKRTREIAHSFERVSMRRRDKPNKMQRSTINKMYSYENILYYQFIYDNTNSNDIKILEIINLIATPGSEFQKHFGI